jgi:hypothetical protein
MDKKDNKKVKKPLVYSPLMVSIKELTGGTK